MNDEQCMVIVRHVMLNIHIYLKIEGYNNAKLVGDLIGLGIKKLGPKCGFEVLALDFNSNEIR
jgi:hypothetical protein